MNSIPKKTLLQPKKILFALGFLIFWISAVTSATSSSSVKVPTEYFANYQIQKDRNRLQELFVDIDADSRIGKIWWTTIYNELNAIMTRIFPYFPQDYNFQVVYKQCLKTTREMQWSTNRENYNSFIENCKNPLSNVNATIQNKYTVKATASTNPSSGPAPLTVTFDARGSSDPSNETIPSRNYFWYYRDIDGIDKPIWYWPVVNYKFNESGIYLVHLTVRSSNAGIFDWETTVSVNVSPKSANVIVYANGKKMDKNKYVKVGIQEAKKGIVSFVMTDNPKILSQRVNPNSGAYEWVIEITGQVIYQWMEDLRANNYKNIQDLKFRINVERVITEDNSQILGIKTINIKVDKK